MGEETKPAQDQKSEAPTCGICHKTKFADGCGHLCSYCQTKFCARCGGRVSLRSNKVTPTCTIGVPCTHTRTRAHKNDNIPPQANFSPRCRNPVIELTVSSPLITSVFKFCSLWHDSQLERFSPSSESPLEGTVPPFFLSPGDCVMHLWSMRLTSAKSPTKLKLKLLPLDCFSWVFLCNTNNTSRTY